MVVAGALHAAIQEPGLRELPPASSSAPQQAGSGEDSTEWRAWGRMGRACHGSVPPPLTVRGLWLGHAATPAIRETGKWGVATSAGEDDSGD